MKKMAIGFIAGALFATAGTAAASTIIEKVTASVRTDYSVEVDGQKVALENAPLAYKGSAYIAVREISNVIGKDVGFEDGVIKISSNEVVERLTLDQYNSKIEYLNLEISIAGMWIVRIKDNLQKADAGTITYTDDQYKEEVAALDAQEAKVVSLQKQIEDLKIEYPDYAN